eukprot:gb/GEZN01012648.1/.p1 GENE.gb/GEZN01012648.1/~~gb/GEZN01012648.1/.p1  ORF type:complete len:290 (-),score=37.44 gb/GEZN01012648.1/:117-986(-)
MVLALFLALPVATAFWSTNRQNNKRGLAMHSDTCSKRGRWGSGGEGGWTVCLDKLKHKDKDQKCVVYSFGINDNWSFDDAAAKFGCEVHGFDPSLDFNNIKKKYDSKQKTLHNWGVSLNQSNLIYPPGTAPFEWPGIGYLRSSNSDPWDLRTIRSIMSTLKHDTIDILKVDAEGAEWGCLRTFMDSGGLDLTSQLLAEFHFNPEADTAMKLRYGTFLGNLSTQMYLFHARANASPPKSPWNPKTCCGEFSYISQKQVGFKPKKIQIITSPYIDFPEGTAEDLFQNKTGA